MRCNAFFKNEHKKTIVYGKNLEEISKEYSKIRDEGNFGASDMLEGNGKVYDDKNNYIAMINYNGTITKHNGIN